MSHEPQPPPPVLGAKVSPPPSPDREQALITLQTAVNQARNRELTPGQFQEAHRALEALQPPPAEALNRQLRHFINAEPEDPESWRQLSAALEPLQPLSPQLIELAAPNPPPQRWLIPHWLPADKLALLTGPANAGKTWLALQLALAIAAGCPKFLPPLEPGTADTTEPDPLGITVATPQPVLYAGYHQSLDFIYQHLRHLSQLLEDSEPGNNLVHIPLQSNQPLWQPAPGYGSALSPHGRRLRQTAQATAAALLVIDSLNYALGDANGDPAAPEALMRSWNQWCEETACALLLVNSGPSYALTPPAPALRWALQPRLRPPPPENWNGNRQEAVLSSQLNRLTGQPETSIHLIFPDTPPAGWRRVTDPNHQPLPRIKELP